MKIVMFQHVISGNTAQPLNTDNEGAEMSVCYLHSMKETNTTLKLYLPRTRLISTHCLNLLSLASVVILVVKGLRTLGYWCCRCTLLLLIVSMGREFWDFKYCPLLLRVST